MCSAHWPMYVLKMGVCKICKEKQNRKKQNLWVKCYFVFIFTCNPGLPSSTHWSKRNSKRKLLQIPDIHASISWIFSFMSEARGWHPVPVASQKEDGAVWPSAPVCCPTTSPSHFTLQPATAGKRIQHCLEFTSILSLIHFWNRGYCHSRSCLPW